jgi:hypothetical protein
MMLAGICLVSNQRQHHVAGHANSADGRGAIVRYGIATYWLSADTLRINVVVSMT